MRVGQSALTTLRAELFRQEKQLQTGRRVALAVEDHLANVARIGAAVEVVRHGPHQLRIEIDWSDDAAGADEVDVDPGPVLVETVGVELVGVEAAGIDELAEVPVSVWDAFRAVPVALAEAPVSSSGPSHSEAAPNSFASTPVLADADLADQLVERFAPAPPAPGDALCAVEPAAGGDGDTPGGAVIPEPAVERATSAPVDLAPRPTSLPPLWSQEEDARLIEMAVALQADGPLSAGKLAEKIAPVLGRPVQGTLFRIRNKLAQPIAAALDAARTPSPGPEPTPAVAHVARSVDDRDRDPRVIPAPVAAGPSDPAPDPAASDPGLPAGAPDDDLTRHLLGLPRDEDWTWDRDSELAELMGLGWNWHQIAAEFGIRDRDVQARFDQLTGFNRDTRVRQFIRSQIIERMGLLSGLLAAAVPA